MDISERCLPTQQRARETIANILETTAVLLEEVGIDSFTTNMLAERAGIPVRSVYRYYPNKLAVIVALWKKMLGEWEVILHDPLARLANPSVDLDEAYRIFGTTYIEWLSSRRGAWAVRRSIRAVPELADVEQWAEDWYVSHVSRALRQRGVPIPVKQLRTICIVMFRSANAIINSEMAYFGKPRTAVIDEMFKMVSAYIEASLETRHQ